MLRYVTDLMSRLWSRRLRNFRRLTTPRDTVQLPPGLVIPPSKERANYYRKLNARRALESRARMTTLSNVITLPGLVGQGADVYEVTEEREPVTDPTHPDR